MFRTKSFNLKLVQGLDQWSKEDLSRKLSARFDEMAGFGFTDFESEDLNTFSTLVYQSIVLQRVYDPEDGSFTIQEQITFDQVPFNINYATGLLQADAGGKRLSKLLSVLGQVFDFKIAIDDLHISIGEFVKELDSIEWIYNIIGMTVSNYRPETGLSGRFVASVGEQRAARELIHTYSLDVTHVIVELIHKERVVQWRLSSTGNVAVRAEEEDLNEQAKLLKGIVLRCQNA